MKVSLKDIKRRARALMKSKVKPAPLLVALVFTVMTMVMSFFLNSIAGSTITIDEERMTELSEQARQGQMPSYEEFTEAVSVRSPKPDAASTALQLALQTLTVLVTAGFSLYALRFVREEPGAEMGNLLDGFSQLYRVLMVNLLKALLIGGGLCCFVIPGVRLFYGYRMAVYLLWDHPDWTPVQCLRFSRLMMNGRKRQVFAIDMSFLWLLLLGSIPFSVASLCLDYGMYGSLACALVAGCAVSAFVNVYLEFTLSLWYNMSLGLIKTEESEDNPPWEN